MKISPIEIENGIYELIRLKLVELGYLPDVTNFLPATPENQENYKTAIQNILSSGKKVITIVNDGSYKNREGIEENRFVISKEDSDPSQTGTMAVTEYTYQPETTNYKKEITSEGLFDLQYRVTMIFYDSKYLGIMEDILMQTLGFRRKVNGINESGEVTNDFWLLLGNYINLDSSKYGERAQMYNVPSVDLIGNKDAGVVSRAEEITIGVSTNPDITNEENDDLLTQTDET